MPKHLINKQVPNIISFRLNESFYLLIILSITALVISSEWLFGLNQEEQGIPQT